MDHNAYGPPSSDLNDREDSNDLDDLDELLRAEDEVPMTDEQADALRRPLLKHEAWLQSIGSFVMLGSVFILLGPLVILSGVIGALRGVEAELHRESPVVLVCLACSSPASAHCVYAAGWALVASAPLTTCCTRRC